MGLRGPLRDPHSRRGQQETFNQDAPEHVPVPAWLSKSAKKVFRELVKDLSAAKVPIKRVDRHAIASAAHCLDEFRRWSEEANREEPVAAAVDPSTESAEQPKMSADRKLEFQLNAAKLAARFERDAMQWLNLIGASPAARTRIGIRSAVETKKAPTGPLAVLQMRRPETAVQ